MGPRFAPSQSASSARALLASPNARGRDHRCRLPARSTPGRARERRRRGRCAQTPELDDLRHSGSIRYATGARLSKSSSARCGPRGSEGRLATEGAVRRIGRRCPLGPLDERPHTRRCPKNGARLTPWALQVRAVPLPGADFRRRTRANPATSPALCRSAARRGGARGHARRSVCEALRTARKPDCAMAVDAAEDSTFSA